MRNLMPVVFGLIKMSFWYRKKVSYDLIRPEVFGKWKKSPNKFEKTQVPLE